jgi:SAM-dependent methyltransferase
MLARCPLSHAEGEPPFFTGRRLPIHCNQLWPDAAAARSAPVGDVELAFCRDTGLIWNLRFEPALVDYAGGYENALHFSAGFQAFAEDLVRGLVSRHGLEAKDVVEIGCGDGYLLGLLARHGVRSATGFDPAADGCSAPGAATENVRIVPGVFDPRQLDRPIDALLCRHVLEHLDDPLGLLAAIRAAIADRPVPVYFEVPNAEWILESVSVFDVIYEHVTYWTEAAIETLMRRSGFAPLSIARGYGDQYLMVEAVADLPDPGWLPDSTDELAASVAAFAERAHALTAGWREALARRAGRTLVWGAGSKGITFANMVGTSEGSLHGFIDINPRKSGLYIPGLGLPVLSPDQLVRVDPDLILLANGRYAVEIEDSVAELGLAPEFRTIAG